MTRRWVLLAVIAALALALTAGLAYAVGSNGRGSSEGFSAVTLDHDAMHDSPAMQRMHGQMPADLQKQCDALHERMDQMMDGTGSMMGGPYGGMMGDHASHHSPGG